MRIRKTSATTQTSAEIVNTYNESNIDAYSCDYVNENIIKCKTINYTPTWTPSTAGGYFITNQNVRTLSQLTSNENIVAAYVVPVGAAADYSTFVSEFNTDFTIFGAYCSGEASLNLVVFYI